MTDTIEITDPRELLNRAEELAPRPEDPTDAEGWIRHWAALGVAAAAGFRWAERRRDVDPEIRGRDLAYLSMTTHLTVAAILGLLPLDNERRLALLWDLTPEAGALNGEWEEWLTDAMYENGLNPGDVDPDLNPAHFPPRDGARG